MGIIESAITDIIEVNLQVWRNEYNRNRRFDDSESGYRHMPEYIHMSKATWDDLCEKFIHQLSDSAAVLSEEDQENCGIIKDSRERVICNAYKGMEVIIDDSLEHNDIFFSV